MIGNKFLEFDDLASGHLTGLTLCYGHFNVLHPGHIRYFENAKKYGQKIIVAISVGNEFGINAEEFLYSPQDRLLGVSQVELVDYVVLLNQIDLVGLVNQLKPSNFVLGKEFEFDRRVEVSDAVEAVKKYNGSIRFDAGQVHYASSNFLSKTSESIQDERIIKFKKACERNNIDLNVLIDSINKFQSVNVLVIGDIILDQYIACDALGMSSEAPIVVLREMNSRDFMGGAGIVASHIASLGAKVNLISVAGEDDSGKKIKEMLDANGVKSGLVFDANRPTTFKARYMVEAQKLFRVSRLEDLPVSGSIEKEIIHKIEEFSPNIDGILISDFLYGVITPNVLEAIHANAKKYKLKLFGDLQCSSQVGSILKFKNFKLLCPTEREARIALNSYGTGIEDVAHNLIQQAGAENLIFKMGSEGFIAYETKPGAAITREHFPALNVNPLDVTGAGDSLLSCMAIGLLAGIPFMHAAAISACMAAISVQLMGNTPIKSDQLKKLLQNLI